MAALINMKRSLLTTILVGILAGVLPANVMGQNCDCPAELCCSQFGYCGTGTDYCGTGCREGPCTDDFSVADIVTDSFFKGILDQTSGDCPGNSFYTRAAFLNALNSYSQFGQDGSANASKREIAAFFAHVTHETGSFCYIEEINGVSQDYCEPNYTQYPVRDNIIIKSCHNNNIISNLQNLIVILSLTYSCNSNQKYYGRGPLQLTWNYNYAAAGSSIGFDGLNTPWIVASDPVISFKTALWFWMNNVHQVISQGFGATIRAINGATECNGGNSAAVQSRIQYYTQYCNQFGVDTGDNLSC